MSTMRSCGPPAGPSRSSTTASCSSSRMWARSSTGGTPVTGWCSAVDKAATNSPHWIRPTLPDDGGASEKLATGTGMSGKDTRAKKDVGGGGGVDGEGWGGEGYLGKGHRIEEDGGGLEVGTKAQHAPGANDLLGR